MVEMAWNPQKVGNHAKKARIDEKIETETAQGIRPGACVQVVLFGESAGAGSIAVHLTSPESWPPGYALGRLGNS